MREFSIYIETDKRGLISEAQKEQLQLFINCLKGRSISLLWQIACDRITQRHIINILRCEYSLGKMKNITIHNEFNTNGKDISFMARWFIKRLPIELYEEKRIQRKDYLSIYYGNEPEGCAFSSCLGNTLYIKRNGTISICPYGENVILNQLREGGKITDVFETEQFKALLRKHIQKRNVCRATCQKYDLCLGSCPLSNGNIESCEIIKKTMECSTELTKKDEFEQRVLHLASLYRG